jgi:hypothetical protein
MNEHEVLRCAQAHAIRYLDGLPYRPVGATLDAAEGRRAANFGRIPEISWLMPDRNAMASDLKSATHFFGLRGYPV